VAKAYSSNVIGLISRPLAITDNMFPKRLSNVKSIPVISALFSGFLKNLLAVLPSFVFPFPENIFVRVNTSAVYIIHILPN